jgi:DNA-binding transcriptional ArsR family regulator
LAQPTRLEVFRLLVVQEPGGLAAGEIAATLDVPHNTLSTHLAILHRAGLVTSRRESRSIIYRAHIDHIRVLALYLLQDCCGGKAEVCAPVIDSLRSCCSPMEKSNV